MLFAATSLANTNAREAAVEAAGRFITLPIKLLLKWIAERNNRPRTDAR